MKRVWNLLQRHGVKLWLSTAMLLIVLVLSAGAIGNRTSGRWEYMTVWFRINPGDNYDDVQTSFSVELNRQAVGGWEFVGRCGHCDTPKASVDFVVFRRPR